MSAVFLSAERWAARRCDRIVTLTDQGREDHRCRCVGRPEQFTTIPSGVDVDSFRTLPSRDAARAGLKLPATVPVILCVGRLTPVKGQRHLLEAMALLPASRKELRLVLVGDGESRRELESLARRSGLDDRVLFTGAVDRPHQALAAADVFVLPSLNEGQGRAVVEAMAAGLPVIASCVGGLPEVLDGGRAGVLVPPGDPGALAAVIEDLLDSPHVAARLAAEGRRRVSRYSEDAMIRRLDVLYAELLPEVSA